MALKNICSIPLDWSIDDYARHTCSDGSHRHLSRSQLRELEANGRVVWLVEGKAKHEKSAVFVISDDQKPATNSPRCPPMNTGLSYRVGEVLAMGIYRKQSWALTMHAQIRMKRETQEYLAV